MGGMSLIFTSVLVRHLLGPLDLFAPMTSNSWAHRSSKQSRLEGTYNLPLAAHSPHHSPTSLYMQSVILQ